MAALEGGLGEDAEEDEDAVLAALEAGEEEEDEDAVRTVPRGVHSLGGSLSNRGSTRLDPALQWSGILQLNDCS